MGLERITAVLQNVLSNYDIDYMRALTATTEKVNRQKIRRRPVADISFVYRRSRPRGELSVPTA